MYLKFLIPIWFLIPLIQCGEREEQKKMKSQGEILGNRYAFLLFEDNESCKIVYKQEHLLVQKLQDLRKLLAETKEKLLSQKEKKLNEIVDVSKGNVSRILTRFNYLISMAESLSVQLNKKSPGQIEGKIRDFLRNIGRYDRGIVEQDKSDSKESNLEESDSEESMSDDSE